MGVVRSGRVINDIHCPTINLGTREKELEPFDLTLEHFFQMKRNVGRIARPQFVAMSRHNPNQVNNSRLQSMPPPPTVLIEFEISFSFSSPPSFFGNSPPSKYHLSFFFNKRRS